MATILIFKIYKIELYIKLRLNLVMHVRSIGYKLDIVLFTIHVSFHVVKVYTVTNWEVDKCLYLSCLYDL